MSISLMEQETTINFSRDERYAFIWTSDSTVMTKLDKRVDVGEYDLLNVGKDQHGNLISKEYRCPKNLISFRSKKRELTEEQKQAVAERFRQMREEQKSQNQF